jgi:molybdenum cofactor cytidylyltransferase
VKGALGAILLAAGGSSRLGHSKQLIEIAGKPLVRRQARLLLALEPACVVVVTGAVAREVGGLLQGLDVTLVHNAAWRRGIGSSLACGIRAMPETVRGALLLLTDQYRIGPDDLRRLVEAWAADPRGAVSASWDTLRGPPVVFPRALFGRLSRLQADTGARALLRTFRGRQMAVPMPNAAFDLDTPTDLLALQNGIQK